MEPKAALLRAYGPGGPHHALQEAADLYKERHGVTVLVVRAGPGELAKRLREDGDVYFTGAEFMLEEFVSKHPNLLDPKTIEKLYPRRVGLLVRKGNPLDIKGVDCLARKDVDLMAVHLEGMEPFLETTDGERIGAPRLVFTGHEGVEVWRSSKEIDAWITYKSWHVWLEAESDFIEFSCDHALRHTMVAIPHRTPNREAALKFIEFLKTPEAREVFLDHGWE